MSRTQHPRFSIADKFMLLGIVTLLVMVQLAGCLREATAAPLDAVVMVRSTVMGPEGGFHSGTGTVISAAGHVLTCHHVLEFGLDRGNREAVVSWRSGRAAAMRVVGSDAQLDLCLLAPSAPLQCDDYVPIAGPDEWPWQGDTVELAGYGGGQWRHWQAKVSGYALLEATGKHQTLTVLTKSISGDSGGAIMFRGKLVAVLWGGPLAGPQGPMLATQGTATEAIRPFVMKCGYCPPCSGNTCPMPPPPSYYQRPAEQRPQRPTNQRPLLPIRQPPAQAATPPCRCDDRFTLIEERLAALEARPQVAGPPGKDGRDGQDGICDPQAVVAGLQGQLPTAVQIADALFAKYGEELRGPPGHDGATGRDGTMPDLDAAIAERIREKLRIEVQHE